MSAVESESNERVERRIRCSCGFRTGWFDPPDANHIGSHHSEHCDGEVEYKERDKEGRNYSDNRLRSDWLLTICPHCDDGRNYECKFCGARFRRSKSRNDHQLVCMGP